jgi:tetratricopeptide (TPR) repeat protein
MNCWQYALTQAWAIAHYLQLTFWPSTLTLDYGTWLAPNLLAVWPAAALLIVLLTGTALAVWRKPLMGFLGIYFFACLAPTSSFIPVATQTIAEHRMYLALAAPVALVIVGGWTLCRYLRPVRLASVTAVVLFAPIALALAITTAGRNDVYRDAATLWRDTLAKRPDNPRAYQNLALLLADGGDVQEAESLYRQALRLNSRYPEAHNNLGKLLADQGHQREAAEQYRLALDARPDYAHAHNNLGILLAQDGRWPQALEQYYLALEANPQFPEACNDLANALATVGRPVDALRFYQQALQIDPGMVEAHNNMANLLAAMGHLPEAIGQYRQAVRLSPRRGDLRCNLAWLMATHNPADPGARAEAVALAESACQLAGRREAKPLAVLAAAYAADGRFPDAVNTARRALLLAQNQHQAAMAQAIDTQLAAYRASRPFRMP